MNPLTPQLYILAGPNGVGKTTYAGHFLPVEVKCLEFINADMIAQGLSPFDPSRAAVRAGRLMLARLDELVANRERFAFETTLSGRGYASLLRTARQAGYRIHLDFLWVPSLTVTNWRVAQRVRKGGHDIPAAVQERRFLAGLRNLFTLYRPLVDHCRLFDDSGSSPLCIAEEVNGRPAIHEPALFDKLPLDLNLSIRMPTTPANPEVLNSFPPETLGALRAMNRAFASVVVENHRLGLPVIQYIDGEAVETPAESLLPLAKRYLGTNGEPLPSQIGG